MGGFQQNEHFATAEGKYTINVAKLILDFKDHQSYITAIVWAELLHTCRWMCTNAPCDGLYKWVK